MAAPLKSILLATNLKDYNKVAFDVAASLAIHYQAKLVLLHVLEKLPEHAESLLAGLLGEESRKEAYKIQAQTAHQSLVGKNISSAIIRTALDDYCKKTDIGVSTGGAPAREIIVSDGDVEESILKYAKEYGCGMIVLAAHEGLFAKSSLSSIIKDVMRRSTIPVLVVPHVFAKTKL